MPALTHGRVKNGFNGYATRVKLPNGGVSNTQPIGYNGGQQPKRNFKAEYNAQVNAPNALTNSIGSSFTTKRANARRAGDPDRKLLGLPEVSFSAPGQAGKKRKVPLASGKEKATSCLPTEYPNSFSFVVGTYTNPGIPGHLQLKGFCNYCFVNFGNILPPNCITPPGFIKIQQDTNASFGNDQIEFFMYGFPPNTIKAITITLNNVPLFGWTGRILPQSSAAGAIQVIDSFDPLMPIWADGDIIKVEFLN